MGVGVRSYTPVARRDLYTNGVEDSGSIVLVDSFLVSIYDALLSFGKPRRNVGREVMSKKKADRQNLILVNPVTFRTPIRCLLLIFGKKDHFREHRDVNVELRRWFCTPTPTLTPRLIDSIRSSLEKKVIM
jgi:hypothetical protein